MGPFLNALRRASQEAGSPQAKAPPSARSASDANMRLLDDRVDRLTLVCMGMWTLLQEKTGLTEEELMDRVQALDMADGVADGRATRTVTRCTACDRVMAPRHLRCIYCGADKLITSAFDTV